MKRLLAIFVTIMMVTTLFVPTLSVLAEGEADWADMELAEMPANIIADPGSASQYTTMSYALGGNVKATSGVSVSYTEAVRVGETYWTAGDTYMTYTSGKLTEAPEAGANYAVSVRLKNDTPEVGHTPVFGLSANYNGGNPANGGTVIRFPVANTSYETYTGVFTVNNQTGQLITMGLDTTINRSEYTELATISMDISNGGSLYVAKELAYDVKVEPVGLAKVFPGSSAKIKAQIVNQVGIAYGTDHNFAYTALNADRTAVAEGITVTPNGDGTATVAVADTVAEGTYVILAASTDAAYEGFRRGMEIEVIGADAFADSTPVMPANLITSPRAYNYSSGNSSSVGTSWAPGSSRWLNFNAKSDVSYTSGGWIAKGAGLPKTKYGNADLLPNTTYVYKTTIMAVGTVAPYFNIEYAGDVSKVATNEYGTIGYAPGFEAEDFVATFNTGANTSGTIWVGLTSGLAGNAVHQDLTGSDQYLAIEAEYDIKNTVTGSKKLFPGSSTTLKTEVVNQMGIKGTLSQDISYVVLNADKTAFADGITVTANGDGTATVAVASTVATGTYNITAVSASGLVKSAQIEVVSAEAFADKTAAKPDNFVLAPANLNALVNNNGGAGTFYRGDNNSWDSQKMLGYLEKTTAADSWWGAGPTMFSDTYKNASYEVGKNYVVSARLKNGAPERKATVKAGFSYSTGIGTPVSWDVSSTEFETYSAVFTPNVAGSSVFFGLASNVDRTAVTDADRGLLVYDYSGGGSLYVAEEVAYEVANEITGDAEIFAGDSTTLKTEVLNQVGIKGNMSQDVTYVVLTADRSAFAEGITVTEGADGTATVEVAEDAVGGEYVILAIADNYDLQKAAVITVLGADAFVDHVKGDMPANMFTNPTGYNLNGGNSGVGVGWSDGSGTPPIYFKANSDFTLASDSYWGAHGIGLSGFTPALEANKSYVTSVYVKHVSGSGTPTFAMVYQKAASNHSFPVEYGADGLAVTSEYQQYKGTFNTGDAAGKTVWVGLRSGAADDIVALDNTQGFYMAEEVAHDIAVEVDEIELLAGESAALSAQVVNQIGTTGTLTQEYTWYALNADRTAFADGITVTEGEDGEATVEVASSVAPGTYVIYAKSSYGIGKGVEIEVVTSKARVNAATVAIDAENAVFSAATVDGVNCANVMFVVASYDSVNNKLIKAVNAVATVDDGSAALGEVLTVTVSGADLVRVFAWDADTLAPIKFAAGVDNAWEIE